MEGCHIEYGMKMTLHIDEDLLERVMAFTGAKTKTEAIANALKEIDRRARLKELLAEDWGMSADDWKHAIDPAYDLESMRVAETPRGIGTPAAPVKPVKPAKSHARKSRSGR
jgi:Arc/MetJ family transcription regulator